MPGEEAQEFGRYVRKFFAAVSPEAAVRRVMDSAAGYDPDLWRRAAAELGLPGLMIGAELGGSGAGLVEGGVLFEELGRSLAGGPFLGTVGLCAPALAGAADRSAADAILERIASGDCVAALAYTGWDPTQTDLTVESGRIDGIAEIVVDGAGADTLLVAAGVPQGGVGLYQVRDPDRVRREPLVALDPTRRLARLTFDGTPVTALDEDAAALLARARDTAALLLAAEQLGVAETVFEMTLAYAGERFQFGRAIGSFQVVKHRLVDLLVETESARSVVQHALAAAETEPATRPLEAALARSVASDAAVRAARAGLQIHGGIGFTWEHSLHLYLKRATASAHLFGPPALWRRRLAAELDVRQEAS